MIDRHTAPIHRPAGAARWQPKFTTRSRALGVGPATLMVASLMLGSPAAIAQSYIELFDGVGDATVRRTDGVPAGAPLPPGHALPDLNVCRIGAWQPSSPAVDLFTGDFNSNGAFVRIELEFDGLINPPGPLTAPDDPFRYGPNPLIGFFDIDADNDVETGGELLLPEFRYLGSAARFSGLVPQARFADKAALDVCPGSFDDDFTTGPYFPETSGEDFHLFFVHFDETTYDVGSNGDLVFEPGEQWLLRGPFLQRSNVYEPVSFAIPDGSYIPPDTQVRFTHKVAQDRTTVTLVSPLSNAAAAAALGEPVEPLDGDAINQSSIHEGLDDLWFSARFATSVEQNQPEFPLIEKWEEKNAANFLDPVDWQFTGTFLGAFVDTSGASNVLAFSDIFPNVLAGDFNGDQVVDLLDRYAFDQFIIDADGGLCDEDTVIDGVVDLINFGENFNVFDVNYDGYVDGLDSELLPRPFDPNGDGDVDLGDYAALQRCSSTQGALPPSCIPFDTDVDGGLNALDWESFVGSVTGPVSGMDGLRQLAPR